MTHAVIAASSLRAGADRWRCDGGRWTLGDVPAAVCRSSFLASVVCALGSWAGDSVSASGICLGLCARVLHMLHAACRYHVINCHCARRCAEPTNRPST
eukprot:scaffold1844_cov133-Isochrysis_galbana.AAC.7